MRLKFTYEQSSPEKLECYLPYTDRPLVKYKSNGILVNFTQLEAREGKEVPPPKGVK